MAHKKKIYNEKRSAYSIPFVCGELFAQVTKALLTR